KWKWGCNDARTPAARCRMPCGDRPVRVPALAGATYRARALARAEGPPRPSAGRLLDRGRRLRGRAAAVRGPDGRDAVSGLDGGCGPGFGPMTCGFVAIDATGRPPI